jgi:hypothetical protein
MSGCNGCTYQGRTAKACETCMVDTHKSTVPSNYKAMGPVTEVRESPEKVTPKGLRYNTGKRRYDLLPPDAMAALADLMTIGSRKYAERNWELGMAFSDASASLERHLQDWKAGIDHDDESRQLQMAHVAINAIFLLTWQLRDLGQDDRPPGVCMPKAV